MGTKHKRLIEKDKNEWEWNRRNKDYKKLAEHTNKNVVSEKMKTNRHFLSLVEKIPMWKKSAK
jgi:hypothetical protein